MSIARPWAFWRRVQYSMGFFLVLFLVCGGVYSLYSYTPASCMDTKQNGDETGIDCGGNCVRMCTFEVKAPYVSWVKSFRATDGLYNAVAYVENRNTHAGTPQIGYNIRLFDSKGMIAERRGMTELPPNTLTPIFEGRIETRGRIPTETNIEFDTEQLWVDAQSESKEIDLVSRELTGADKKPVLVATLRNNSLDEVADMEVVATIFNREKSALTASRTKIPIFPARSTRDITFTWQEPIAKTIKSCEVPSDVILAIDLSGSMNDDGGTPQQPITAVLESARNFVGRLGVSDQVGLVTYATVANTDSGLTHNHSAVIDMVGGLQIAPESEQGSTNTGEAIRLAREELLSVRHNVDARKVLILLTDGLATAPEQNPEEYARSEADSLKASHIELFTIGLGEKLNEVFLTEIATDSKHYFKAPSISTLDRIYESITSAICEEGAAIIEIIPKQKGTYTSPIP